METETNTRQIDSPRTCNEAAGLFFPAQFKCCNAFDEYKIGSVTHLPTLGLNDLVDDFWACTLENVVYLTDEHKFYQYKDGIYKPITENAVYSQILTNLNLVATQFPSLLKRETFLPLKSRSRLKSVVERAQELLAVNYDYFQTTFPYTAILKNGVLNIVTREFKPHSPKHPVLDTMPTNYIKDAKTKIFLEFLNSVLSKDDINVLQQYCGLILAKKNSSQKLLVLTGEAGWGKSTVMNIVGSVLGWERVGIVREQLFSNPNELAHYEGKHLLYCPDMRSGFLDRPEASLFKQLVGGDPVWADTKDGGRTTIHGHFPVVLACNARPTIRIDSDTEAWARRLIVLEFAKPDYNKHMGQLTDIILKTETSGVLNWMLDGFATVRNTNYEMVMTVEQRERASLMLLQSESALAFVQSRVVKLPKNEIKGSELYENYVKWCGDHGLEPVVSREFLKTAGSLILKMYGKSYRHDLREEDGGWVRGWKGVGLALEDGS